MDYSYRGKRIDKLHGATPTGRAMNYKDGPKVVMFLPLAEYLLFGVVSFKQLLQSHHTNRGFSNSSNCELRWVQKVLTEIGVVRTKPTNIHQDNLIPIYWTQQVQGLRILKNIEV